MVGEPNDAEGLEHPDELLHIFRQAGVLKRLERTGWRIRGIFDPESVSDHSYRLALMAIFIGDKMGLDTGRMVKMALLHDLAESIIGDITPLDGVDEDEKRRMEEKAIHGILGVLPNDEAERYLDVWLDFEDRRTPEGRAVRDLDKLEMAMQALEYREVHPEKDFSDFLQNARDEIKNPEIKLILDRLLDA